MILYRGFGQAYTPLSPSIKTATQIAAAAAGNGDTLTYDQWNYYAQQPPPAGAGASGLPGIELTPIGIAAANGSTPIPSQVLHGTPFTIDQWWSAVTAVTGIQSATPIPTPTPTPAPTPVSAPGAVVVTTPPTTGSTTVVGTATPASCSFYQTLDPTTNTCGLNYYLVGGVVGVGLLLMMMSKKKGRG
jgi:hypothetical protein